MARPSTGDPALDSLIDGLLDAAGAEVDRDQLFDILASGVALAGDRSDRLDLKITNAALKEMRAAFNVFAPYRDVSKVTIFGSARTRHDDPLYAQTVAVAKGLADRGWMIVTGAGPGIMEAGMEGAGRDRAIGVLIRLPFEGGANDFIAGDPKLVEMKYFFTRKLMLMKESGAFVALPGGFGTLDETFELLTLTQTGKSVPVPIVLLDTPGGSFWKAFEELIAGQVEANGLISPHDRSLYCVTDSVDACIAEIEGFYRNYDSIRFVGDRLVIRLRAKPTDSELDQLNQGFGDLLAGGRIERTRPLPPEVATDDRLDLPRIALRFDLRSHGRLRQLINALNALPSAPAPGAKPPTVTQQAKAAT
ncbi:MAG: LOG family protein [Acidobacteria bacterium]|nr:LOG family protein [Acidobacteriota bacterium]